MAERGVFGHFLIANEMMERDIEEATENGTTMTDGKNELQNILSPD